MERGHTCILVWMCMLMHFIKKINYCVLFVYNLFGVLWGRKVNQFWRSFLTCFEASVNQFHVYLTMFMYVMFTLKWNNWMQLQNFTEKSKNRHHSTYYIHNSKTICGCILYGAVVIICMWTQGFPSNNFSSCWQIFWIFNAKNMAATCHSCFWMANIQKISFSFWNYCANSGTKLCRNNVYNVLYKIFSFHFDRRKKCVRHMQFL